MNLTMNIGRPGRRSVCVGGALALLLACLASVAAAEKPKVNLLRIGSSGAIANKKGDKEKGALETLEKFIRDETGLENKILPQKTWPELTEKLAKGDLQLGVYEGFEFAWAQAKDQKLKPLALAVNVYRYPVVFAVIKVDNPAPNFAALRGQSISIPTANQGDLNLFVEHETHSAGKATGAFFSKVNTEQNPEDALDDVVDGNIQVAVVDRVALEAFKRRKPGRFKQLKEIAHSEPLPPPVIAYYGDALDSTTQEQFAKGLFQANRKEAGQTLLTLFHLTSFEPVPNDLAKVLEATRKNYPPSPTLSK